MKKVEGKITRKEVLRLAQGLKSVSNYPGAKFSYAISKNSRKLEVEIECLKEAQKPSEGFSKYETERIELCKEMAKKDESGNPLTTNNSFDIDDIPTFDKKMKELNKKFKTDLEEREKQIKEVESLLSGEVSIELHKVSVDDLPENITATQLSSIDEMIVE